MKTDSLFYRIFNTAPGLFFELIGQTPSPGYQFKSIEVKQTAFRIDGVFLPPANAHEQPVYFVEVQFHKDPQLYHRLFAEVFLFLEQNPTIANWQAVVFYAKRSLESENTAAFQVLLSSLQVQRFYLDELPEAEEGAISFELIRLIISPNRQAVAQARRILDQLEKGVSFSSKSVIMELIETTLVYKFPQLSREELARMLGLAESVKQTRVYQEGIQEGMLEGSQLLILKQLTRRIGEISPEAQSKVEMLSLSQLEALGEALLDFSEPSDLTVWLEAHSPA